MSRRKLKSAAPNLVSVTNSRSPVAGDHLFFNKGSKPMNDAYAFSTSFDEDAFNLYNSLPRKSQRAIKRLMDFELSSTHGFLLRRKRFKEMYAFDWQTRRLLSMLLQTEYPIIKGEGLPNIFESQSDVAGAVATLEKNGYAVSSNKLTAKLPMDELQFQSKDKTSQPLSGKVLLEAMEQNNPDKLAGTYWLKDQNTAAQMPEFARIAFDPYILSVVSGYLGCTPIHVQTNLWFSFAGEQDHKTLSRNAQFFHQDKEFVKFIKVFIYLNDVTTENGPHCYIEGSHIDELNQHGIPYSTRLSDEQVLGIYGEDKLRIVEGEAGTIIFGDTVAAHKGLPLKKGSRLMLQLEYAASLYMSPVCPFGNLSSEAKEAIHPGVLKQGRLFANYGDASMREYQAIPAKKLKPKRALLKVLGSYLSQ